MADERVERKKVYCNSCKNVTNHELKGRHAWAQRDPQLGPTEELIYSLWVCAGCETGTMEQAYNMQGMVDEHDEPFYDYSYYPKRAHADLAPKRFAKLKPILSRIYKETISCYNDGSLVLCSAGLRALLEGVCEDQGIPGTGLRKKIDGLKQVLPNENIIRGLHQFRFTGNKAIHKLEAPKKPEVKLAMEVMEDLLNFLYELDYKASRLRASSKKR